MGWAAFGVIFSQTHLVTLVISDAEEKFYFFHKLLCRQCDQIGRFFAISVHVYFPQKGQNVSPTKLT
jgi:hypothetical protein